MPKWAKWVVGGAAVLGLAVAAAMAVGSTGVVATIGASMFIGGIVSGSIDIIDQLHDSGTIDWTQTAISTLSGTAYGLVVGLTGGTGGSAVAGKLAVAGGTSLLNSWNKEETFDEAMRSLALSLAISGVSQALGYWCGKNMSNISNDPTQYLTHGDISSSLWSDPVVKTGVVKFVGGVIKSIFNDIF